MTLSEKGIPTSRDENWKYANLRPLEKVKFAPPVAGSRETANLTAVDLPEALQEAAPPERQGQRPFVVAIDGPAAAGKGTLARRLADRFGLAHLDTGSLYRATALLVLDQAGNPNDPATAEAAARRSKSGHRHVSRRPVAWRGLDVCGLGSVAWLLFSD